MTFFNQVPFSRRLFCLFTVVSKFDSWAPPPVLRKLSVMKAVLQSAVAICFLRSPLFSLKRICSTVQIIGLLTVWPQLFLNSITLLHWEITLWWIIHWFPLTFIGWIVFYPMDIWHYPTRRSDSYIVLSSRFPHSKIPYFSPEASLLCTCQVYHY